VNSPMRRLGLVGCGAIGRTLALQLVKKKSPFRVTAVWDQKPEAARSLTALLKPAPRCCSSLSELVRRSDFVLEAASQAAALVTAETALKSRKPVLLLSTGGFFLQAGRLTALARKYRTKLYLPSGAVAGMDALKAARQIGKLRSVTITSSKPPKGFAGAPGLTAAQVHRLASLQKPLVLYEGPVEGALKRFPANVNVSATTALASHPAKVRVRVVADPAATLNRHEIRAEGDFGFLTAVTENRPSKLNPKTSALAVQSALALLERLGDFVEVGS
jgi:aspartate dehydrogenase